MSTVLNKWDLDCLAGLFRRASAVALEYFDNPPMELKSDNSVVTAADREIEAFFSTRCDRPEQGVYLIGEETVEKHDRNYIDRALQGDFCWILDPIDGTAPYSAHLNMWGISLGLMQHGHLTEGAVALPVLDILLATWQQKIYCCKLSSESAWEVFTPQVSALKTSGHIAIGQLQAHQWRFDGPNQLFAWSSCVGSVYWVLSGLATAYCGDFKLWDIAGLLPILRNANYPIISTVGDHKLLSADPADNMFEFAPGARCWKVKAPVIAAPDMETALDILKNFHPFA